MYFFYFPTTAIQCCLLLSRHAARKSDSFQSLVRMLSHRLQGNRSHWPTYADDKPSIFHLIASSLFLYK
ncbi:hypothetical protein GDO78_017437 [Eleutherodactylus coqui]|uniref:Uncharacterized protein n=1 Tax=Eleutherodactylus coqui TaxID=57060 RepID=A0A8J6EPN5_ELECQ|nr:hypothetical protein GDO78_017437 [Eleutherodactylus coqui]